MQALARYWSTEYDWRKIEAKMNALTQFKPEIDRTGRSFSFTSCSKHDNALPLIVTHGWPGSNRRNDSKSTSPRPFLTMGEVVETRMALQAGLFPSP